MIHVRDRATPENINNAPGTFFSQMDVTVPLSAKTTKPMTIKMMATIDNATKTVVDNILKRFNGYVKINSCDIRMVSRRRLVPGYVMEYLPVLLWDHTGIHRRTYSL